MEERPLDGKIALVTGAPAAGGSVVARTLAAAGVWVAVNYRQDFEAAKRLVDQIRSEGGRAMPIFGDTADIPGAWAAIERIDCEWGPVDILVENGAAEPLEVEPSSEPLRERQNAAANLARLLMPGMIMQGWGRIILLGDPATDLLLATRAVTTVIRTGGSSPPLPPFRQHTRPRADRDPWEHAANGPVKNGVAGPVTTVLEAGDCICVIGIDVTGGNWGAAAAAVVRFCLDGRSSWSGRVVRPADILDQGAPQ